MRILIVGFDHLSQLNKNAGCCLYTVGNWLLFTTVERHGSSLEQRGKILSQDDDVGNRRWVGTEGIEVVAKAGRMWGMPGGWMEKTSSDFELAWQWMALGLSDVEKWVRKSLVDRGYKLLTLVWSTLNLEVGMENLSRYIQVKVIICLSSETDTLFSWPHLFEGYCTAIFLYSRSLLAN